MGTTHKELAGAERTDDLRRAGDERNHAFGLSIGHLAQMLLPDNDGNQKPDGDDRRRSRALRPSAVARHSPLTRGAEVGSG
jgi:hypothetical protein